jgi:hypothetical protein
LTTKQTLLAACMLCCHLFAAAQVSIYAKVDSMHLVTGDALRLHITIRAPEGTRISTPRLRDSSKIELIDTIHSTQTIRNGDLLLTQTWTLTALDSGTWLLPALPFGYVLPDGTTDTVRTQPIPIYAQPMRVDTTRSMLPIAPIMVEPLTWRDLLPFLWLVMGIGAAAYLVYWFWHRKKERDITIAQAVVPLLPPHEVALRKLQILAQQDYLPKGLPKMHYTELTYILREYIDRRYNVATLEQTTDELLDTVRTKTDLPQQHIADLARLLRAADLVKFAKAQTTGSDDAAFMAFAKDFIVQTTTE